MKTKYFTSIFLFALLISVINCSKEEEKPPTNQPPTCKIIAPTNWQQIPVEVESVIVTVEATDSDGIITQVQFFIDGVGKESATTFPYNYNWITSEESPGLHTIKATSLDNDGGSTSDEIFVFISEGGTAPTGMFTDQRDEQTYFTIEIGSQDWMAENLNYETSNSFWYFNDPANGDKYGRLYTWDDAITVCPTGWHLPSDDEWKTLEMYLGMSQVEADQGGYRGTDEGSKLKSIIGWNNNNGINSSGFNGLPGGVAIDDTLFQYRGLMGFWWAVNEESDELAWSRKLNDAFDSVWRGHSLKNYAYSVRCIKD